MKKFESKKYSINYEKIYSIKYMKESFLVPYQKIKKKKEFLKTEVNTAPFEYQFEIKELLKEKEENKEKLIKEITKKYIFSETKDQININWKSRETLELLMEDLSKIEEIIEVLKKISQQMYVELYSDSFPRFIRSKIFLNTISKYSSSCANDEVYILKITKNYPFKNEDFIKPFITTKDVNFLNSLVNGTSNFYFKTIPQHGNFYTPKKRTGRE
jgi:hypothetical protein